MIDAGIDNPESQQGIDFCTEQCPYDECLLFAGGKEHSPNVELMEIRARSMKSQGMSIVEIAKSLGVTRRTVYRYLKRR